MNARNTSEKWQPRRRALSEVSTPSKSRHIASQHAQGCCPEWRYLKDLCQPDFAGILREQPEMRLAKNRERLMNAIFGELPEHMRGALTELRTLLEMVSLSRESAAFLIAYEIGRESGRRDAFRDPRVMLAPEPQRRALPASTAESESFRLHMYAADEFDANGWRIK